jgi:hypothetical protein
LSWSRQSQLVSRPHRQFWIARCSLFGVAHYASALMVSPRGKKWIEKIPILPPPPIKKVHDFCNWMCLLEFSWFLCWGVGMMLLLTLWCIVWDPLPIFC